MAFVIAPTFAIRSIQWTLDRPSQVNVSAYTGTRSVAANPWHGKWSAHVDLAIQQSENTFRATRSFLARCEGSTNIFRLYATVEPQNSNYGVTVASTAAAGSRQLSLSGYATSLTDGQYITVNGQLLCLTADQSGSTVYFEPPLREQASAGTTVVTSQPYALVYMTNSQLGYTIGQWRQFGMSFDCEEAILEDDDLAPEAMPASPVGAITLPAVFNNTLGVTLRSTGSAIAYTTPKPYDMIDFERQGPTNQYYVSWATGNDSNAGTSGSAPWKTLDHALATAASPAVINILDKEVGNGSRSSATIPQPNGKFKIKGVASRSIIHGRRETDDVTTFAWSASGAAYVTTVGRAANIYRAHFDGNYRDGYGIPTPLTLASSIANCQATPGTFYWNSGTSALYVHMIDGRVPDPDDGWIYHEIGSTYEIRQTATTSAGVILYENLEYMANVGIADSGGNVRYRPVTTGSANGAMVGFKNCLSYGASGAGFQVYDADVCVMERCVAAYNHSDGFNYHSFISSGTHGEFITVYENNCVAYNNGFDGMADQATLGTSSNGTTSHDSLHILRTNGNYHHSNGAVFADVNGVVSVGIGCIVQYPTGTANPKACFWHSGTGFGSHYGMYLWGCAAYDNGDGSTILVDNNGTPNGESNGQIYLQSWRGQTSGSVTGTLKDWSGNVLANLAAAV